MCQNHHVGSMDIEDALNISNGIELVEGTTESKRSNDPQLNSELRLVDTG